MQPISRGSWRGKHTYTVDNVLRTQAKRTFLEKSVTVTSRVYSKASPPPFQELSSIAAQPVLRELWREKHVSFHCFSRVRELPKAHVLFYTFCSLWNFSDLRKFILETMTVCFKSGILFQVGNFQSHKYVFKS